MGKKCITQVRSNARNSALSEIRLHETTEVHEEITLLATLFTAPDVREVIYVRSVATGWVVYFIYACAVLMLQRNRRNKTRPEFLRLGLEHLSSSYC